MNILIDNTTGQQLAEYNRPAIKTWLNARYFPKDPEIHNKPSRTVPDQTMPLRTLLDRYARGLPISGPSLHPVYHGEEFMPDVKRLDISEIHELKTYVREQIQQQQADLQKPKQKSTPKKEEPTDEK